MNLERTFHVASQAGTGEELLAGLLELASRHGFATGSILTVEQLGGSVKFREVNNLPHGYLPQYHSVSMAKADPVMGQLKSGTLPVVWDRLTYAECQQLDAYECMADHGLQSGIGVVMHLPNARHVALGVERPRESLSGRALAHAVGDLQLYLAHITETAFSATGFSVNEQVHDAVRLPVLTARQKEVLGWAAEGKTAWETAAILGIDERTVNKHRQGAISRLGTTTIHQAILVAIRAGYI